MNTQKKTILSKSLVLVALSHAITDLSQGALPILLPFLKSAFALSYSQVGLIVLAQNVTSSVIQPVFGYITDRFPLPWLVPAGVLLSGVGMAVTGLAPSYIGLLAIVIITGLGIAAFHPQGAKMIHNTTQANSRGQSMAVFSVGGNLGQACGSVFMMTLLTLPGSINNTLYFCLPALLLAALLWLNLSALSPQTLPQETPKVKKSGATTPIPLAMVSLLLFYIFFRSSIAAGLTTYIPLYFADYLGGSHAYASYLVSGYLLSGVAGTYVGGVLGDKFGRKTIILGSMLLTLPMLLVLPHVTGYWTLPLVLTIGFVYIASFSSTTVLAQEMMPGYEALAASLTIGFSIGLGGLAVTLLGYVADHFGVPSVFTIISVIPVAAAALAFFLPGRLFKPDYLANKQGAL
ncbi:MFS transporter [Sporomusa acidovorans]|uniref:Fosmidomycin resistance protein n=1 Tax=Sporomusa acidovorans (strain ATCC 49682 / DSM 3132 / Mol) TaxID=1123286 RepID=A0ABZ3IZU2_SPOA4|nr:MFS transporter [Sporomusa acidovorans]OZC18306.1 fosmidomycin resistance protein [Sporomusa acidovorans DSM 3132]SDF20481.1 MFS transporter, FSR family, fosmidomycin resistance protein [Sporomusa acidovorans]